MGTRKPEAGALKSTAHQTVLTNTVCTLYSGLSFKRPIQANLLFTEILTKQKSNRSKLMLCHFSIMTQLHPRLHQIPQGKKDYFGLWWKSLVAGACGRVSPPPQILVEQKAEWLGSEMELQAPTCPAPESDFL